MVCTDRKKRYGCVFRGSTVIEMSYIIPLFLGLFMLIVYAVFYFHDKAVINAAAAETAVLGVQASRRGDTEYDLEQFFNERTQGKLICMTETEVSVSETDTGITVSVSSEKGIMELSVCQKALRAEPEHKLRILAEVE